MQSPIDIKTRACTTASGQPPLQINYRSLRFDRKISNSGHGFNVNVQRREGCELLGGPLPNNIFHLEQFHFHWGLSNDRGSEHTVNGKAYSGEVHLVHYNTEYEEFESAMKYKDGVAVIGVFLKAGASHADIANLCQFLPSIRNKGDSGTFSMNFDLKSLLPTSGEYWTYSGSLTTGRFEECVTWIVYKDPIEISPRQLSVFRELCGENYRSCQPINGRQIQRCSY